VFIFSINLNLKKSYDLNVEMPHFKFPCHCVYWSQVDEHENIKSNVLPVINDIASQLEDSNPFKACRLITNFSKPSKFLDANMIQEIVWKNLTKMLYETNCCYKNPTDFMIMQYWFNKYEKENFQEVHSHFGLPQKIRDRLFYPTFSAIYILHSEEKKNSTLFTVDDPVIPFHPIFDKIEFNTGDIDEIKEGTIIIFPNSLKHSVLPVNLDGRITIAFNIACSFST